MGTAARIAIMGALLVASAACTSGTGATPGPAISGHVHSLAWDGPTLLLGTHAGLWEHADGASPRQRSTDAFDVMGLARLGDTWIASGHPAEGSDGHPNLGLLVSQDGGVSFAQRSADGIDFHRLTTSGDRILGISSADGALLRSDDAGRTWTNLGGTSLFDVVVDPSDPQVVVGSSEQGVVRSTDGGRTFSAQASPPVLGPLAWSGELIGVDVAGTVMASSDAGASWTSRGTLPAVPVAVAVDGPRIAALVGDRLLESADGGRTFTERLSGVGDH